MFVRFLLLLCFASSIFGKSIPEDIRREYAIKINDAFLRQSLGKADNTNLAFLLFQQGYNEALEAGESVQKLKILRELFVWYRKYGYSAGVMLNKSGCSDEYISKCESKKVYAHVYSSEYGNTPEQAQHTRQFMLGVGMVVSGVLTVSINPPILGRAGVSLCTAGFVQMYLGLSACWAEKQKRQEEIKKIEKKVEKIVGNG